MKIGNSPGHPHWHYHSPPDASIWYHVASTEKPYRGMKGNFVSQFQGKAVKMDVSGAAREELLGKIAEKSTKTISIYHEPVYGSFPYPSNFVPP
jgi:hypothetical protein